MQKLIKYRFSVIALILIINSKAFSQSDSAQGERNILYIEIGGIGGYGSINYERILLNKKCFMFGIRAGLSTYHLKDYKNNYNPDLLIPLSINSYYGKNHKVELGIGQTFTNIVLANLPETDQTRKSSLHTNFSFGYRYQKTRGLMFRCVYSPIVAFNRILRRWMGLSIGYIF